MIQIKPGGSRILNLLVYTCKKGRPHGPLGNLALHRHCDHVCCLRDMLLRLLIWRMKNKCHCGETLHLSRGLLHACQLQGAFKPALLMLFLYKCCSTFGVIAAVRAPPIF